jgi:hypothetical protein
MKSPAIDELFGKEHGKSTNYQVKKGTPSGDSAEFNALPPGQDIFDQAVSDLDRTNRMKFKEIVHSGGYDEGNA